MNLETGEQVTWGKAEWFGFSKGSGFLAVKRTKADPKAEHDGTDVILRELGTGVDQLIGSVASWSSTSRANCSPTPSMRPTQSATASTSWICEPGRRSLWTPTPASTPA